MTAEALSDQVGGMLNRVGIPADRDDSGRAYFVLRGSALVVLEFHDSMGVPVVSLSSPVLQEIDMDTKAGAAFITVNELNRRNYFAKFCLYPEESGSATRKLEHDLLGTNLQTEELVSALDHLSRLADHFDDQLKSELGGVSFEVSMENAQRAIDT
jgi:hypothetical protein